MSEPLQWKVQLFKLNYDEREYNAVLETLKSGWITMGQRTVDFETAYAKELGEGAQCLAVANGTAALHIAVLACVVGPGDEVIVPSLTFIADLNTVQVSGGKVVIGDVTSMSDWAIDPADIEAKIMPRTKAVACSSMSTASLCNSGSHSAPLAMTVSAVAASLTCVGKPPPPAPTTPACRTCSTKFIADINPGIDQPGFFRQTKPAVGATCGGIPEHAGKKIQPGANCRPSRRCLTTGLAVLYTNGVRRSGSPGGEAGTDASLAQW